MCARYVVTQIPYEVDYALGPCSSRLHYFRDLENQLAVFSWIEEDRDLFQLRCNLGETVRSLCLGVCWNHQYGIWYMVYGTAL